MILFIMNQISVRDISCTEEEKGNGHLTLSDFPDDILYLLFRYLDIRTLGRLCLVSHRFKALASADHIWNPLARKFRLLNYGTNRLLLKERCRLARNRENGIYREISLVKFSGRQLPWMQRFADELWVSSRNCVRCFHVSQSRHVREQKSKMLVIHGDDVSKFVVRDNKIISGCRDGSIHIWNQNTGHTKLHKVHPLETQTVDCHGNTIVSGSRDATVKVISIHEDGDRNICNIKQISTLQVGDRVWCVKMSNCGSFCACGTGFCEGEAPIGLWDLERAEILMHLGSDHKYGAGVLDMQYESDQTLLTCGYDTNIRLWDIRIGQCVCKWEEPFDSAVYCLKSDGNMTIFSGTSRHGMVRLWDKRHIQPIQVYYTGKKNSPVYSLEFDNQRLYTALDVEVQMLDFSYFK